MKKYIALSIAAAMLLGTLTACGDAQTAETSPAESSGGRAELADDLAEKEPSGIYYLTDYTEDGEKYDVSELDAVIEYRSDGTGTLTVNGEPTEFTWGGGKMEVDGVPSVYVLSGETVTITEDSTVLVFSKTPIETAGHSDDDNDEDEDFDDDGDAPDEDASSAAKHVTDPELPAEFVMHRADTKKVEWETYGDMWVNIQIPKGWTVTCTTPQNDLLELRYEVTSPDEIGCRTVYMVSDPNGWYNNMDYVQKQIASMRENPYPDMQQAAETMRYITEISVKGWCEGFSEWDGGAFEVLEDTKLEEVSYYENSGFFHQFDVARIHGKRTDAAGRVYEGIYRAGVYGSEDTEPMINPITGEPWTYPVYHVSGVRIMEAPADEYEAWLPVLQKSLYSLEFTEAYISFLTTSVAAKSAALGDSIGNPVYMAKESDATLGYERIYDTQTGDVYMAYSGFMDDYSALDGKRYAAVTDDMYETGISGWIDKN